MRLTLTILCGTRAGQRFVVGNGDTLRVGRTAKADVVVADDPTMSALHYELEWRQPALVVRDLQSRNGLFLNGERVTEATLVDGDQIRAGRTYFSVSVEDPLAPAVAPDVADETRAPGPQDATRALFAVPAPQAAPQTEPLPVATLFPGHLAGFSGHLAGGFDEDSSTSDGYVADRVAGSDARTAANRLYAVVDGENASRLIEEARRAGLPTASLAFIGSSPYLSAVAPYLVEISHDSQFTGAWQAARDRKPGILIESPVDFDELLVHLRSIFCRRDDAGQLAFFRFYEPNLLYQWLQGCTTSQLASFFGCLTSVVLGFEPGSRLLRLTHDGERLAEEVVEAG